MINVLSYNPVYKDYIKSYNELNTVFETSKFDDLDDTYLDMLFESGDKKSILEKIGQAVIDLFKKFGEFLNKVLNLFQNYGLQNKSDLVKAEKMISRHPEFKNEILEGIKAGDFDLSDLKSLKELDDAADKLTKMALDQKIDPDTLVGKWKITMDKFKKALGSQELSTAVKTIGTTVTIASGIALFKTNIEKTRAELKKINLDNEDRTSLVKKISEMIDKKNEKQTNEIMKNVSTMMDDKNRDLVKALHTVYKKLFKTHMNVIDKTIKTNNRLFNVINASLSKLNGPVNKNK